MERREDIRAAMRSLLTPASRPEPAEHSAREEVDAAPVVPVSASRMIAGLRVSLAQHGIRAEDSEIAQVIWEQALSRPDLCRALLAAYLLGS